MRALLVFVSLVWACEGGNGSRYGFYRSMGAGRGAGARRVFGGAAAAPGAWPAACALLDRYWAARCSGAVLAPRWALTAAHCVAPHVAYVKYNSPEGAAAAVHYLYRHPGYRVRQEDEGRGMDVTQLQHDVGLVRTRSDMALAGAPPPDPLRAMRLYNPGDLANQEVQVLGFGRTEESALGEQLFEVRLRLVRCERGAWLHCVCGVGRGAGGAGVCAGDSGGPALYRGAQVAVTSMGPLQCAARAPPAGAASVLTALYHYAELLNATMHDTDAALRMRVVGAAPRAPRAAPAALLPAALLARASVVA